MFKAKKTIMYIDVKGVDDMTSAKMSKANAMLRSGYSYAEIAKACGVPESTVYSALNK